MLKPLKGLFSKHANAVLASVPDGAEALVLGQMAESQAAAQGPAIVYVARDGQRMQMAAEGVGFFAPGVDVIQLPSWDCLPYDRVSPNANVVARRLSVLAALAHGVHGERPTIVMTTVNAALQLLPAREWTRTHAWAAQTGGQVDMGALISWLETNGYLRTDTVRETGEYAVRGGILDLFAPGFAEPVRLDFFGDTLETIRPFDPETQRSTGKHDHLDLVPMSEVVLSEESISRFRRNYVSRFGAATRDDALYQSVSDGRRYAGMEHWLPLFHENLETVFDYVGDAPVVLDPRVEDAVRERVDQIEDHCSARQEAVERKGGSDGVPYKPIDWSDLYLSQDNWTTLVADRTSARLDPFAVPAGQGDVVDLEGRGGRTFAAERAAADVNVFDAVIEHIGARHKAGQRVIVACWSEGARDRLSQVLTDHGLERAAQVSSLAGARALPTKRDGTGGAGP